MSRGTKLELTWVGKEERPRLEPRILVEDPALSHHAATRREGDLFDNRLIQGDNLLALKALEAEFTGKVKCVFIDPPYNTGSAFEHYDDGLEHSLWLTMMRDRLELIHRLLAEDGSMWVTIDDNEAHYFKVMCDEIFGRYNFVATCVWQKRYSRENRGSIGDAHDYIFVYSKNLVLFSDVSNQVPLDEKSAAVYKNPDNNPKGRWRGIPMTAQGFRPNQMYEVVTPSGVKHRPPEGRCWGMIEAKYQELRSRGRIYFGKDDCAQPSVIRYLSEVKGLTPWTWWPHDEVGHNDEAKKESHSIFGRESAFTTPKPERLIKRILDIATNPGDLVLDSFAGSGTTGAVAHKMGRRWIMVELGDHARTHIVPRLDKVVDGADPGGVTEAAGWQGGGGYRFYRLAPSMLEKDRWGNWVISKEYNPAMLAEAMCKHMGFTYAPSQDPSEYWNHGFSSERDFLFVTTHALTHEMLEAIAYDVGPERHLLICCKAFATKRPDALANLTLKRIPAAVLHTCEWGRDDYSLRIADLPVAETGDKPDGAPAPPKRGRKTKASTAPGLFEASAEADE